jgi:hypothetical protein
MQNRRTNTSIAYDPKVLEFQRYCDYQYPHEPETVRHLVAPDKVYNFMFYQAHRDKRKPGKPKRGAPTSDFGGFSSHDYDSVIARYVGKPPSEWVQPKNPLGFQQVNTYKSSLIELHKEQVANRANTYVWSHHIWTIHCEELYKFVLARKPLVDRLNYKEKVDQSFSFFKAHGKAHALENAMWLKACNVGLRSVFRAVR